MNDKYLQLKPEYTTDTRYRAEVPKWVDEYLKWEARERGENLKDLISEILQDWAYGDNQRLRSVVHNFPSYPLWVEWRKEEADRRRKEAEEKRRKQQEAIAHLTDGEWDGWREEGR